MLLEEFGGHVREDVEGVALLDQADAFGGQAFELDGSDFGAVLFVLAAALQILVVVEPALRAVSGAVEEVDDGPEQFLDVGLEACVREGRNHGVEDVDEGRLCDLAVGEGPRIGLVVRAVAVELHFGDDGGCDGVLGWCCGARHGDVLSFVGVFDRDPRGLFGVSS